MIHCYRIKERRKRAGLTLREAADIIGVREATMHRYESGKIKNIPHDTIAKLSSIFGCSPSYLMGWTDETDKCEHGSTGMPVAGRQLYEAYERAPASIKRIVDFILEPFCD